MSGRRKEGEERERDREKRGVGERKKEIYRKGEDREERRGGGEEEEEEKGGRGGSLERAKRQN